MSTRLNQSYAQLSLDGFTPVSTTPASPVQAPPSILDGTLAIGPGPVTVYSVPICLAGVDSFRFVFAPDANSTLDATLTLETSCDLARNQELRPAATDLLTWIEQAFDVPDGTSPKTSSFAFTGTSPIAADELRCTYLWVRMKLVVTTGSGSPTVRWCLKGSGGR